MFTNKSISELPQEKQEKLLKLIEERGADYGVYPLSAEQERMWFLYQLDINNPYYNGMTALELEGNIEEDYLRRALEMVVERQNILKTIYITINGKSYQVVNDEFDLPYDHYDLSGELNQEKQIHDIILRENVTPFDLTEEIPIKAVFIRTSQKKGTLYLKMHHICSDGWSYGILVREFKDAYESLCKNKEEELPELTYSYADYGIWQKQFLESDRYQKQARYWRERLRGCKEEIHFCFEREEKEKQNKGAAIEADIQQRETEGLIQLSKEHHTSVFTVALALYFWNLWNYSGQNTINVGTPVANRQNEAFQDVIGYFANTLVLRADISKDMTFGELVDQLKENTIDAMANQDIPFDKLVEELKIERKTDMTPLFQIMFSLRNKTLVNGDMMEEQKLADATMSFHTIGAEYVDYIQFKMILTLTQYDNRIQVSLGYNKDVYEKEYMEWFIHDYLQLIKLVVEQRELPLSVLPKRGIVLPKEQKVSFIPSEQVVKAENQKDPEQVIYWQGGKLFLRTVSGQEALPGVEGEILVKPDGVQEWFLSGDKGYIDCHGCLIVTRRKYDAYQIKQSWYTVEDYQRRILKNINIRQCVITTHRSNDKIQFMIYYTGEKEVALQVFYDQLTEDEKENIEVRSLMLNYIPLSEDGSYDTVRLDHEIYEAIKDVKEEDLEQVLTDIYIKNNEKEKENYIDLNALYQVESLTEEENTKVSSDISHLYGGTLEELPYRTLGDLLKTQAEKYGDKHIRFIQYNEPETSITYRQLYEEARKVAKGLYERGIRKGDKVIMLTKRLDLYVKSLWGLMYMGAVPVPLGPVKLVNHVADAAIDKFLKVYDKLAHPVVITSGEEIADVEEVAREFQLDMSRLWKMEELSAEEMFIPDYEINEKDTTIILFTSGSTGMPKGVELCHRNILKRSQATTIYNKQNDKDISLNWMPLDHVGGVVMFHIRDVFGGIEQIQVETAEIVKSPLLWMEYVNQYRATLTWAPNFAYGLVVQKRDEIKQYDWDLSCLRFILNGGELIQEKASLEFLKVLHAKGLNQNAMYPSWGMSETSSGVLFSQYFGKRNWNGYVEVGEPIPGDEFRIVDEQNHAVPQGVVGSLQIRGETVTKGYYDASDTNRESFSEDGWFITGDLAIMNQNQITLTGRNNDLVIINGVNYTCTELEQAGLDGAPYLDVVVALGVTEKINTGEKLAVFYVNNSEESEKNVQKGLRQGIFGKFGLRTDYIIRLTDEEVPRGALEKVQRKKIKQRFQDGIYDDRLERRTETFENWFYQEQWSAKAFEMFKKDTDETYLILCDKTGMAEETGKRLKDLGKKCYYVYPGTKNSMKENKLTIDMEREDSYEWLFAHLMECHIEPEVLVHAWSYTSGKEAGFDTTQQLGIFSIQEVIAFTEARKQACKVIVVSNKAYSAGNPEQREASKATLSGFLRSAQLEIAYTNISYIDFDTVEPKQHGSKLVYECLQEHTEEFIRYQQDKRCSMQVIAVQMSNTDLVKPAIKAEGLYVLTGGLGGIGIHLAKYLIKQYHAELLLLGRSSLEENPDKRHEFEKLKEQGKVYYQAVDITQAEALEKAITEVEQETGKQAEAIFHLAGNMDLGEHYNNMTQHLIGKEPKEQYQQMFQAKGKGTDAIYSLLKSHSTMSVINFSSCNSIFGGNSFSAYSAANSYLDAMTDKMQAVTTGSCININWSMWEHTGMSESIDENMSSISESMGYKMITPECGIPSLECILQRRLSHVIVGISGTNRNMNQKYGSGFYMQLVSAEKEVSEELTELEEKVKKVWASILGHSKFRKTDKFFEVGGNSIMSIQLAAAMNKVSSVKIEVVDLFKYTTVEQLAEYIAESEQEMYKESENEENLTGMTF